MLCASLGRRRRHHGCVVRSLFLRRDAICSLLIRGWDGDHLFFGLIVSQLVQLLISRPAAIKLVIYERRQKKAMRDQQTNVESVKFSWDEYLIALPPRFPSQWLFRIKRKVVEFLISALNCFFIAPLDSRFGDSIIQSRWHFEWGGKSTKLSANFKGTFPQIYRFLVCLKTLSKTLFSD